jgi:hypothetical protein
MQSIASLNLVSNPMPYKMGFCENKKGKLIGQVRPSEVCFQSNIGSFFGFDIYRFVGDVTSFVQHLFWCFLQTIQKTFAL